MRRWSAALGLALWAQAAAFAAPAADIYNPRPDSDDVLLPMPCGGSMAFRKVYTQLGSADKLNKMKDAEFKAGSDESASPHAQMLRKSSVQGGFRDAKGFYYLLGKYEVTVLQYRILTQGKCPATAGLNPRKSPELLPVVDISWFEAMEAARAYSGFLQKAKKLPEAAMGAGKDPQKPTARLPTDSEWEFAARGGLSVSTALFENDLPFESQDRLADYAWVKTKTGEKARLHPPGDGIIKPNPLKLYDMLGNAMEMTCEPFRAVRTGRLHGQAGGFTARGGSFRTEENFVSSAYRVEKPHYSRGEENRATDTGMRLALALPVTASSGEVRDLNAQVNALETETATGGAGGGQDRSVAMIDEILAKNEEARRELARSEAQNREARQRLERSEEENRKSQERIAQIEAQNREAKERLERIEQSSQADRSRLERSEESNRRLADEKTELLNHKRRLEEVNSLLSQELESAQEMATVLKQDVNTLKTSNNRLSQSIKDVRLEVTRANEEREGMRDVAVRANLRLGGFLCRALAQEKLLADFERKNVQTYEQALKDNPRMTNVKVGLERHKSSYEQSLANLDALSRYYADTLSEAAGTYDLQLFGEQLPTVIEGSNRNLERFMRGYHGHLKNYGKRSRDMSKNQAAWISQCYKLIEQ